MKKDKNPKKSWGESDFTERCLYANDLIEAVGGDVARILVAVHSRCVSEGFTRERALVEIAHECLQQAVDESAKATNGVLNRHYSISLTTDYFYDHKEQKDPPKAKKWIRILEAAGDLSVPEYVKQ